MEEKKFANRVSISEIFTLLKGCNFSSYEFEEAEKKFLESGTSYYRENIPRPNLAIGKYTYELTDDAIVYHWPFECDGEGPYGYQINEGSRPYAFRDVRNFYLKKFGQEYLDYLLGEDVATLNENYQQMLSKNEKTSYQKNKK